MSDFIRGIENLYENFIFRDVLSFIIPGAIVTFSLINLVASISEINEIIKSLPGLGYIVLFGLFYVIGFAIQCFAEFILWPIIRNNLKKLNLYTEGGAEHFRNLYKTIKDDDKRIRLKERFVVFKQMCQNSAFAMLFPIVIISIKPNWLNSTEHKVIFGSLILCTISLLIGYGYHLKRLELWNLILTRGEIDDFN